MSSETTSSSIKSLYPPTSFISSNYDNLEIAKAKAAESIINVDQFFLGIDTEIKVYSDKLSLLGDNSEELNDENIKFENSESQETGDVFYTELGTAKGVFVERDSTKVSRLMNTEGSGINLRSLPTMKQILDTAASEHYKSGRIALKSGLWTDAITKFTKCIHLRPYEPSHYANRAEVYFQLTDFQSAIADYKHACILDADNGHFFERLAFLYVFQSQLMFDQAQYSAALESICKAIEMFPDNQSYQIRAIVSMAALNRHSECLALIDKQIEQDNSNPDFFVLRAKLHANFRNFTLSYYDLIDAIKLDPTHEEAQSVLHKMSEEAKHIKHQAIEMALYNRLHEAINKISLAIDLDPICGDYHLKRGSFYRRLKDFTGAIDDFLMAMDKEDHNETSDIYIQAQKQLVLTFNDFGVECFHKNYFEESLILLNKAINSSILSEEPCFYMNRGDCFFRLSNWIYARADYERASLLRNGEYKFLAQTRMGLVDFAEAQQLYTIENQYTKSLHLFNNAIENNPTIPGFWLMRSRNRFVLEDFRNARIDFICFILLSNYSIGNNKDNESFFKRIFPNKTFEQVMKSKLAKNAKIHLSTVIKNHLQSLDIEIENVNRQRKDIKYKKSVEFSGNQFKNINELISNYNDTKKDINWCMNDRSFMKSLNGCNCIRRSSLTDIMSYKQSTENVCGIVGRNDGSKYWLDAKGSLSEVKQPVGWRTFNGVINLG